MEWWRRTLMRSFLSSRRAQISTATYNSSTSPTVTNTGMASRKFSSENTVEKSMVFGGTTKSPPNDVRWLHWHCVMRIVVRLPTCKTGVTEAPCG